jgi:hypothetical protein
MRSGQGGHTNAFHEMRRDPIGAADAAAGIGPDMGRASIIIRALLNRFLNRFLNDGAF